MPMTPSCPRVNLLAPPLWKCPKSVVPCVIALFSNGILLGPAHSLHSLFKYSCLLSNTFNGKHLVTGRFVDFHWNTPPDVLQTVTNGYTWGISGRHNNIFLLDSIAIEHFSMSFQPFAPQKFDLSLDPMKLLLLLPSNLIQQDPPGTLENATPFPKRAAPETSPSIWTDLSPQKEPACFLVPVKGGR